MAILLYKKGEDNEINGIKCTIGRFPVNQLQNCLEAGWKTKPEDTQEPGKPGRKPKAELEAEEAAESRIGEGLLRRSRILSGE